MMYTKTELKNAFFFKLGTAHRVKNFTALSDDMQNYWTDKFHQRYKENTEDRSILTPAKTFESYAQYIPEFSEITSVAFGLIEELTPKAPLTLSIDGIEGNEKDILEAFAKVLEKVSGMTIAGYNVINYQIPFLVKKMLIYGVKLPFLVNLRNKKPWDINSIDIMRDYQGNMFGDIDLGLVAAQFGVTINTQNAKMELETAMKVALAMSQK